MQISSDQIRKKLQGVQFVWNLNPKFETVSDVWWVEIRENCKVNHLSYIDGIWECENYALQFKAHVERFQYQIYKSGLYQPRWRWAIGEIIGMKSDIFGNPFTHAINIIFLEAGIIYYEPQTDEVLDNMYGFTPFYARI